MPEINRKSLDADPGSQETGLVLAMIVSHLDPDYMGSLQVEKLRQVGNDFKRTGQMASVKFISPFVGITDVQFNSKENVYNGTQKSYGMWMIPPDIGTVVVCVFIEGDPARGYYIGCIQEKDMNFMIPGYAATSFREDGEHEEERLVVAEYNKKADIQVLRDTTKIKKPQHPFFNNKFHELGLVLDDIRGITTSSARREWPSAVFGISTPGPIDKDGPTNKYGKHEYEVTNKPWSRLGGTSFVMDDGDDKFLRKKTPGGDDCGPPEYAAVEDGELDGIKTILHNELVRIRTRTGHQILLHNSEDLIYIGNGRGTAWIELTSDGKMDIFCADSINIRTKKDFNFYADRDFNFEAGRNFNIKVHKEMHTHVLQDSVLIVERDQKIHIKNRKDETIEEEFRETIAGHVKKVYKDDYTHNVFGRMDLRVEKGVSMSMCTGSAPEFAPFREKNNDGDDPCANDPDKTTPIEDVNGPTPDRVDIKIFKDMRIEHIGVNVDHTIDGYLKTKIKGAVDINTDSTWKHTSGGDIDIKAGGHIFNTSGGSNETLAGGNIIETAPQIHMNGPQAGTAPTAAIASIPEEARISAKATYPHILKTHNLPDLAVPSVKDDPIDLISIMRRIPTPEPYPHHENLDPKRFKPDEPPGTNNTNRDSKDRYVPEDTTEDYRPPADLWKKYTTKYDTFAKVKK